jgi:uncharacterized membrane protein
MFSIIGGDGKEYGPVTADQVKAWMAAGRANLATKVKLVGTDQWKPIAEVPEITGSAAAGGIAAPIALDRFADLDLMSCYARSWDLLKANFWPLVGVNLLIAFIFGALAGVERHGLYFIGGIFNAVTAAGLFYYFLLKIRGRPATIGDAFAGFTRAFLNLVALGVVVSVFLTVGFLCLIIPGIYLFVAYFPAKILAVDKGLGFWEAMETSRRVVTRNWWQVFGLLLMAIPVMIAGALCLGVGIFVASPVVVGALAYAYEDLFNRS